MSDLNKLPQGILVSGINKGLKTNDKVDRDTGEVTKVVKMGLAVPKPNGFDDEVDIIEVKIPDDLKEKGLSKINGDKGKKLIVEVGITPWSFSGKVGVAYRLLNLDYQVLLHSTT